MSDSYGAIFRDAARKVAAAVRPHATLDNAQKAAGIAKTVLETVAIVKGLPKKVPPK